MAFVQCAGFVTMICLSAMPAHAEPVRRDGENRSPPVNLMAASSVATATSPVDHHARERMRRTVADFRVIALDRGGDNHRITAQATARTDLSPADRGADLGWVEYQQQRRRGPSAAVDARMSLRLDTPRQRRASFGMGGIGGALLHVTNRLRD